MASKQGASNHHSTLHIVLLGTQFDMGIIQSLLKRPIDELIFATNSLVYELANEFRLDLRKLGIESSIIQFTSNRFETMLSEILATINCKEYNECQVNLDITYATPLMSVAACVASNIVNGKIICDSGDKDNRTTELYLSNMMNLTSRKKELLGFLTGQKKPFPQSEITDALEIPRSGVSRKLSDLEEAGYIERFTLSRKKYVSITPLGASVFHAKDLRSRRIWNADSQEQQQSYAVLWEVRTHQSQKLAPSIQ